MRVRAGAGAALVAVVLATALACTPNSSSQGDGKWHASVTAAERNRDASVASAARQGTPLTEGGTLPAAMARVPMPKQLLSVGTGNRGLFEPMSFGIISGESCDATYPEMTSGLQAVGLTTLSTGYSSVAATSSTPQLVIGWLVVQQSDGAAVSITFTPGPLGAGSCNVQGIGFTPVHLTLTGVFAAAGDGLAVVGCLAIPGSGFILTIWGARLGGHSFGISASFKGGTVGQQQLDKNTNGGPSNELLDLPVYGYTSLLGLAAQKQPIDESKVAAVTDGSVTLAKGLASGALNLAYRGKGGTGTVTGYFSCGTYPLGPKQQTPAPTPLPTAAALPAGFPAAFPAYPGSTLQKADSTDAGSATLDTADWTTTDSIAKVYAFYNDALQKGDWQPDGPGGLTGTSAFIPFKSRSVTGLGGALGLDSKKQPGKVVISVLFNIPK